MQAEFPLLKRRICILSDKMLLPIIVLWGLHAVQPVISAFGDERLPTISWTRVILTKFVSIGGWWLLPSKVLFNRRDRSPWRRCVWFRKRRVLGWRRSSSEGITGAFLGSESGEFRFPSSTICIPNSRLLQGRQASVIAACSTVHYKFWIILWVEGALTFLGATLQILWGVICSLTELIDWLIDRLIDRSIFIKYTQQNIYARTWEYVIKTLIVYQLVSNMK